jgi:alcohol dehydrogenase (cytochrome c)
MAFRQLGLSGLAAHVLSVTCVLLWCGWSVASDSRSTLSAPRGTRLQKCSADFNINAAGVLSGKRYFDRKCASCHSIAGDLNHVANRFGSQGSLQRAWLMPSRTLPISATLTAADGLVINGVISYIDEFKVSMRLSDGTERSFRRNGRDPQLVIRDPLEGHKALLTQYVDSDVRDVTAYLASTRSTGRSAPIAPPQPLDAAIALQTEMGRPTSTAVLNSLGSHGAARYSPLTQIDFQSVGKLTLAWTTRLGADRYDRGPHLVPVAGVVHGDALQAQPGIGGPPAQLDDVLYVASTDNVRAVDARDGHERWHFNLAAAARGHIEPEGLTKSGHTLYVKGSDSALVAINARTGTELWRATITRSQRHHLDSGAPVVAGRHVLVGGGSVSGSLQSFDPDQGNLQWQQSGGSMRQDEPPDGLVDPASSQDDTSPVRLRGVYDPDTHLYIYAAVDLAPTTGAGARESGARPRSCSISAVNVETGVRAWHQQTCTEEATTMYSAAAPVLADVSISGQVRKLAMMGGADGCFYVVDRITGERLLTSRISDVSTRSEVQSDAGERMVRAAGSDCRTSNTRVPRYLIATTEWQPGSYDAEYGLFYTTAATSWSTHYRVGSDPVIEAESLVYPQSSSLNAIDPTSGAAVWSVRYSNNSALPGESSQGVLTTAGRLLFSGDGEGNLVARDPANGKPLWHIHLGTTTSAPETYMLDGHQYILVAGVDTLYAFWIATPE